MKAKSAAVMTRLEVRASMPAVFTRYFCMYVV